MSAVTSPGPSAKTAATLHEILGAVAARDLPPAAECFDIPLSEIGLDSARFVAFLVAVEEQLGFVWTDDVPREALATLRTLAEFVADPSRRLS